MMRATVSSVITTQAENTKHFVSRVVSEITVRMLSGRVVVASSFGIKTRTCASVAFIAGILSFAMDCIIQSYSK